MTTIVRKGRGGPRPNSGGARPGAGRPPTEGGVKDCQVRLRLPGYVASFWREGHASLSGGIRRTLQDVADGDAVVIGIDTAGHLAVAPWLAARLAEVEAQDRDDTDLEDWLRALLDALADASQRRRPR
jgi:hypothetical protein